MAQNRSIGDYGGPYTNKGAIEDPSTEADAEKFNRLAEDAAQLTRTSSRIVLHFPTVASGNATATYAETQWGSGPSYYPTTIARASTGRYTITMPASFADALGVIESVSLQTARGSVNSLSVFGVVQCTASANVIEVAVFDAAGALVDLTAGTSIRVEAR
jgi:hypothetical protein